MSIKVKDLKDQIGAGGSRPFLYCELCGNEFSGNKGDYWDANPGHIFRCCKVDMRLVTKHTVYQEVD